MKTYKFDPETRKALVAAMAEILGTKQKHLGVKTCAYKVGDYNVDRNGLVTGPENPQLLEALGAAGFAPEAPEADLAEEQTPEAEAAPDAPEETAPEEPAAEPETDHVVIEIPRDGFTPQALDNLCKMVAAKEELIKLAIGEEALPIQLLDDRVAFPWLSTTEPELVEATATFIAALCKTAREKKRVTATPQPTGVNDRYRFRCAMLHIGMIGSEYAAARTRLLRDLSGNSGWLNGPPEKAPEKPEEQAPEAVPAADEAPGAPEQAPQEAPADSAVE
jgi:hypothetical protein